MWLNTREKWAPLLFIVDKIYDSKWEWGDHLDLRHEHCLGVRLSQGHKSLATNGRNRRAVRGGQFVDGLVSM